MRPTHEGDHPRGRGRPGYSRRRCIPRDNSIGFSAACKSTSTLTYGGVVNLFDYIDQPLIVPFAADDPLRRCIAQVTDELAAERPGRRAMAATLL